MEPSSRDHSWLGQVVAFGLILCSGIVLGLSIYLEPDPNGFGTHRQLGLGMCTFKSLTEFPCPMCGMTTSFALMSQLSILKAILTQPFGVVLYLLNLLVLILSVLYIAGKNTHQRVLYWIILNEKKIMVSLIVGLLLGWIHKVVFFLHG